MWKLVKTFCVALSLPTSVFAGSAVTNTSCSGLSGGTVFLAGETLTISSIAVGEVVTWTQTTPAAEILVVRSTTATTTMSGTLQNGSATVTAAGDFVVDIRMSGSMTISCSTPSTGTSADGDGDDNQVDGDATGQISGSSQTGAISTGTTNNSQSRFGASNTQVTQNNLFISTKGDGLTEPDWNAWASVEYRKYSSALDGESFDAVIGVDRLISQDMLVGVLLGYGRMDLTDGTNTSDQTSLAIGPYFTRQMDRMLIDGFLTYARPEYETTAGNFTSTRLSLGLSASGGALPNAPYIAPYFDLKAFQEDQPAYGAVAANKITSYTASMGAQITALQDLGNSGLTPHLRVGLDAKSTRSTLAATDRFVYGRLGLGLSGQMGAGFFTVDVDTGKTRSDVFDRGIEARWEFSF